MKDQLLKKLQDEIIALDRELKMELPKEIKRARELGDLRENAEYHAAKERQTYVQARIAMLQKRVSDMSLINLDKLPHGKAAFGSTVHLTERRRIRRRVPARDARRRRRRQGPDLHVVADWPRVPRQGRGRRGSGRDARTASGASRSSSSSLFMTRPEPRHRPGASAIRAEPASQRVALVPKVAVPQTEYSPDRRTALVLTGTGTDGAYHAGALQALNEAGVRVDLVAGRGIGAVGALFGAIDGGRAVVGNDRTLAAAPGGGDSIRGAARIAASPRARRWPRCCS